MVQEHGAAISWRLSHVEWSRLLWACLKMSPPGPRGEATTGLADEWAQALADEWVQPAPRYAFQLVLGALHRQGKSLSRVLEELTLPAGCRFPDPITLRVYFGEAWRVAPPPADVAINDPRWGCPLAGAALGLTAQENSMMDDEEVEAYGGRQDLIMTAIRRYAYRLGQGVSSPVGGETVGNVDQDAQGRLRMCREIMAATDRSYEREQLPTALASTLGIDEGGRYSDSYQARSSSRRTSGTHQVAQDGERRALADRFEEEAASEAVGEADHGGGVDESHRREAELEQQIRALAERIRGLLETHEARTIYPEPMAGAGAEDSSAEGPSHGEPSGEDVEMVAPRGGRSGAPAVVHSPPPTSSKAAVCQLLITNSDSADDVMTSGPSPPETAIECIISANEALGGMTTLSLGLACVEASRHG